MLSITTRSSRNCLNTGSFDSSLYRFIFHFFLILRTRRKCVKRQRVFCVIAGKLCTNVNLQRTKTQNDIIIIFVPVSDLRLQIFTDDAHKSGQ